ncbi:MAG: magnesium/cobalt transporter CorA [Armatimonadetes bacterium]|nr:magnesium/cobalt transporter CorA [Armatimonadota bacterium]
MADNDGSRLHLVWYTATELQERQLQSATEVTPFLTRDGVTWLHVQGLTDPATIEAVGEAFGLHPLALEDVLSGQQRSKAEEYDGQDFVVAYLVHEDAGHALQYTRLSLFVGPNYVLSLLGGDEDLLEPVRQRLRTPRAAVRQHGVDHLMHSLIDLVVDSYFPVLEDFGEYLEFVQDETLLRQRPEALVAIQHAKRELLGLRRAVWPLREILNVLMRDDNNTVTPPVRHYLRDCYDHVVMLIDTIETYREMASDLMDAYMSAVSNRLNSVMKILTVIATLFMPLTFIVGVYGMNFRTDVSRWNMPELTWRYGYPLCWAVMIVTVIGMLLYFRKLGWIGGGDVPCVEDDGIVCGHRERMLAARKGTQTRS